MTVLQRGQWSPSRRAWEVLDATTSVLKVLERLAALTMPVPCPGRVCARCGGLRPQKGECDVCRALRTVESRTHITDEVEWLVGTDAPESIAHRLGYASSKSLARVLQKYGRPDLAVTFERKPVT